MLSKSDIVIFIIYGNVVFFQEEIRTVLYKNTDQFLNYNKCHSYILSEN